jgi:hypothetical protein
MITTIKQYFIEIVAAAALIGGAYLGYTVMHARLVAAQDALKAANDRISTLTLSAKARDAGDAVRERQRASVDRQLKETQYALQKALAANPGWANQRVPAAVLDGLRGPTR